MTVVIREAQPDWTPTKDCDEAVKRKEEFEVRSREGPPIFLCHGCGKIAEGSWNGQKDYPKCSHGQGCMVAHAIAWTPNGWFATMLNATTGPRYAMLCICSPECLVKYPERPFKFE